jgi:hypothetical protein
MPLVFRQDIVQAWNAFCDEHPAAWWWHRSEWLDYCVAYTPGAIDYSSAICAQDGTVLAIMPLVAHEGVAVAGGGRTPIPLKVHDPFNQYPSVDIDALKDNVLNRAKTRGTFTCIASAMTDSEYLPKEFGYPSLTDTSQVIKLQTWERSDLRKSYQPLARQQCEDYHLAIIDQSAFAYTEIVTFACELFKEVQAVHEAEAGRKTRPQRTWDLMEDWLAEGKAVMAVGLKEWEVKAYAYVILYKKKAYYASAALQLNCGHGLQLKLMAYLKQQGYECYELGVITGSGCEKEKAIEFFKQGFGGELVPFPVYEAERE